MKKKTVLHLQSIAKDLGIMLLMLTAATIIGIFLQKWNTQMTNVVVVYILSVVLTARYTHGYAEGIIASIFSLLAFNWFFTEPYFTLKVNDITYFLTFITMTITAVITSTLTTKFKKAAAEAKTKEMESKVLYQLTNRLTDAENISSVIEVTVKALGELLSDTSVGCIYFGDGKKQQPIFLQEKPDKTCIHREVPAIDEVVRQIHLLQTANYEHDGFCDWPIYGHSHILGVFRMPKASAQKITAEQNKMILSILENASLALERLNGLEEQAKNREEISKERYRSNLLRAISHDIRTPLTGIMGSSEMLLSILPEGNYPHELAEGIYQDADWLHALVENILSLTRLQDSQVALQKEPEVVEEVVGSAVYAMSKRLPNRKIEVSLPENILMIPMNARLINQVLINLLDNAAAHSPENSPIYLRVRYTSAENVAEFSVADCGKGIKDEDLERIFQMFYTTNKKIADAKRGIGLGLTICKTIIEAHGGQIIARNSQEHGGAEFVFTLPIEEKSHA